MKTSNYIFLLSFVTALIIYLWHLTPIAAVIGGFMIAGFYIGVSYLSED